MSTRLSSNESVESRVESNRARLAGCKARASNNWDIFSAKSAVCAEFTEAPSRRLRDAIAKIRGEEGIATPPLGIPNLKKHTTTVA